MPSLILYSNNAANPQTLDLSSFLRLQPDEGTDPADPAFTQRVWTRSLLKEGATLSLEQLTEKELQFPVALKGTTQSVVNGTLVQQINQILGTPGATCSWRDDGMTQPTYFDILSGQVQIQYSYFRGRQSWCNALVLIFTQPLGHTAGSRPYATASGVGPLLMISPYASGGGQVIGQSTQAGIAGWGGGGQGGVPSGGIFYPGAPSLAGYAPALLQISYVGPLPNTAKYAGVVPYPLVSLLPDANYQPLISAAAITSNGASVFKDANAVASQYLNYRNTSLNPFSFAPVPTSEPGAAWAGAHRLFAIARASSSVAVLQTAPGPLVGVAAYASVYPGDWGLYDLGTFSIRASEPPLSQITVLATTAASGLSNIDVTSFVMLPDNATWFLNPAAIIPSQYGAPAAVQPYYATVASAPYTNCFLLDDVLGDQFIYAGQSQAAAPSPIGSVPSAARITQYTRGLVPRPDPKNGLPIVAIVGVGQNSTPGVSTVYGNVAGASWTNPQNLRTLAQVNVLERTRYVLP